MVSETDSESDQENEVVVGRKRVKRESEWKRNTKRVSRCKGLEYEDYKGRIVPAKTTGPPCNCKRFKCFDGLTELDQINILQRLLDLPSKNDQDLYIQNLIEIHDVKKRRPRKGEDARNVDKMYTYFLLVGNQRTQVCYKAFLSLLSISDKRVKRLRALAKEGKNPIDKRGKSQSANTLSIEKQQIIRDHIESYPTKLSHYSGKTRKYLDARLCTNALYRALVDKHPGICSSAYFYEFFQ
ncbi:uncharacterized protein LOC124365466 [Homalodisca vitripennis]|uniref:uncharacterized protein LOC124365466 n=1 Tax=Homalodisca vitripennis TaxID=197043 RepID=UPI001EECF39C|nr:uncharacterized protein LOC124365466 [Homalodisca vitripennis]